jgi:hypothetical protein
LFICFMLSLKSILALSTCSTSKFPKIVGSIYGSTYINQIDLFEDNLGFGGYANDLWLTC